MIGDRPPTTRATRFKLINVCFPIYIYTHVLTRRRHDVAPPHTHTHTHAKARLPSSSEPNLFILRSPKRHPPPAIPLLRNTTGDNCARASKYTYTQAITSYERNLPGENEIPRVKLSGSHDAAPFRGRVHTARACASTRSDFPLFREDGQLPRALTCLPGRRLMATIERACGRHPQHG